METKIKMQAQEPQTNREAITITPFLWFDTLAGEASSFYTEIFDDSKIETTTYYSKEAAAATGREEGSVMTVAFTLEGQHFTALNGGPEFEFSPAISLLVNCDTEQEINTLWEKLIQGGTSLMNLNKYPFSDKFGCLKDRYGLVWQFAVGTAMQKITPFLMFTGRQYGKAEEAIKFYTSLFDRSGIIHIERYGVSEAEFEGTVKYARFSINEQEFMATDSNTGHEFTFTPAMSFVINCETQEEIDHFWNHLAEGGNEKAQQCGWLQDRYGVSWQIVPSALGKMLSDSDNARSKRVMRALLSMKKLNIKTLNEAYEEE